MSDAAAAAAERAARNTVVRAVGEIVGKLASLALVMALGRAFGEDGLGVYVLAFATVQIAFVFVDLGLDRYALRQVARDRSRVNLLLWNSIGIKCALAVPVLAIAIAAVVASTDRGDTRAAVALAALGTLLDSGARSVFAIFNAHERGDLLSLTLVAQRFAAAGLGLAALAAGFGVVTVVGTFAAAAGGSFVLALWLLHRSAGLPPLRLHPRRWRELTRASLPFAIQDVFTLLLFRLDAVLLAALATTAAVGRYGAAYRMLEATFFLTQAVSGAFSAMYAYLSRTSDPPLGAVFGRSLKLALVALTPPAVLYLVLPGPLLELLFGDDFGDAAAALRVLAPVVVLMGIVRLSSSLIASQRSPVVLIWVTAGAVAVNAALNVALIPVYDARGAAIAMLACEAAFAAVAIVVAARLVAPVGWPRVVAGPLAAGAAMGVATGALRADPLLAAGAGLCVYAVVLAAVERVVAPDDLRWLVGYVRGRGGRRPQRNRRAARAKS